MVPKDAVVVKLETENWHLKECIKYLNKYRLGDEIVADDDDESITPNVFEPKAMDINTRHYQIDHFFGDTHYYITNVINILI